MKTWVRNAPPWITAVAAVLIPIMVGVVGGAINRTIAESQVSADYVRLAVEILSADAPEATGSNISERALRSWAVDVLESRSPVPLEPQLTLALREGDIVLSTYRAFFSLNPDSAMVPDGELPDGCQVTTHGTLPLYDRVFPLRDPVDEIGLGTYPGLEVQTVARGQDKMVRIDAGWLPINGDISFDAATCFPNLDFTGRLGESD